MQDIKKRSRNLRFSNRASSRTAPMLRISPRQDVDDYYLRNNILASRKAEKYENDNYEDYEEVSDASDYKREIRDTNRADKRVRSDTFDYYRNRRSEKEEGIKLGEVFSKYRSFLLLLFLIITSFLLLTFVFNSATITVTPKIIDKRVAGEFILSNISSTSSKANTELSSVGLSDNKSFIINSFSKEVARDLPKNEKTKVISKAYGKITIYNNFDDNTQKLIKNTRFESKEGKIFRITDTVVVPPKQNGMMGKITVDVTADSVGESYNVRPGKWTIPGFKGSTRYDGFYGETTNSMTGGSNSEKTIVDQSDADKAVVDMVAEAKDSVRESVAKLNKEGFYNLTDDIYYDIKNNLDDYESGKDDKFRVTVLASVVSVNKDKLAEVIFASLDKNYKGEGVYISNFNDMKVRVKPDDKNSKMNNASSSLNNSANSSLVLGNILNDPSLGEIILNVEGLPSFKYKIDTNSLKQDLIEKDNDSQVFNSILSEYTGIAEAKASIFPIWRNTFPSSISKIKVVED